MKILVFGNTMVDDDSLPLRLLPALRRELPEIEFKEIDTVEDLEREGKYPVILDSVKGIDSVRIFEETDGFLESPRFSLHDFDLPIYLRLLKKMGMIRKATIIGVPDKLEKRKALTDIITAIRGLGISNQ